MKPLYTTTAIATGGGRQGHVKTTDGMIDVNLTFPKEIGGQGGATNPEQLFAAGYAACFNTAMREVAKAFNIALKDDTVEADVTLFGKEDGTFALGVSLRAKLPGVDPQLAQQIVGKAHEVCPYSNATRNSIDVQVKVVS